jgi:hypothetical protein
LGAEPLASAQSIKPRAPAVVANEVPGAGNRSHWKQGGSAWANSLSVQSAACAEFAFENFVDVSGVVHEAIDEPLGIGQDVGRAEGFACALGVDAEDLGGGEAGGQSSAINAPVEVPARKSKHSRTGWPICCSRATRAEARIIPRMPRPSMERRRAGLRPSAGGLVHGSFCSGILFGFPCEFRSGRLLFSILGELEAALFGFAALLQGFAAADFAG